ncbi:hypothetical protein LguiA_018346 [Lonicera macranthoides]
MGHKGMKPSIFAVYRQALATLSLAPFAFFLESNKTGQLSFNLLCKIFLVSLFGLSLSINLYAYGLKYTSASVAAASNNMVPVLTFVLAVILRMESISIKQWHGKAKVLGAIVCVCGAFVFAFVNGPPLNFINSSYTPNHNQILGPSISKGMLILGSLATLSAMATWSFWIVMQAVLVKEYPAKLRLLTLQSFFSCIQTAIWAIAMERNISSWKIGWDINLLSVAYCGLIVTGVSFWLRIWTIQKKGPVFTALFTPLTLIITVIFSAFLWKEILHLGSVCGAILLVVGLYTVLLAKNKEAQEKNSEMKEESKLECITP